jgi:hypothetical protein
LTAGNATGANLAVNNATAVAEVQTNLAASLAASAAAGGRSALDYYLIKAFIDDMVDDPLPVLAWLIASEAAATCAHQFQIGDVIEKVAGDAYALSTEVWGLRRCPPRHRPSDDQVAELIAEIATARSNAALDPLPRL